MIMFVPTICALMDVRASSLLDLTLPHFSTIARLIREIYSDQRGVRQWPVLLLETVKQYDYKGNANDKPLSYPLPCRVRGPVKLMKVQLTRP